jgi:hypothetical protein
MPRLRDAHRSKERWVHGVHPAAITRGDAIEGEEPSRRHKALQHRGFELRDLHLGVMAAACARAWLWRGGWMVRACCWRTVTHGHWQALARGRRGRFVVRQGVMAHRRPSDRSERRRVARAASFTIRRLALRRHVYKLAMPRAKRSMCHVFVMPNVLKNVVSTAFTQLPIPVAMPLKGEPPLRREASTTYLNPRPSLPPPTTTDYHRLPPTTTTKPQTPNPKPTTQHP